MEDWNQEAEEEWDSFPVHQTPTMTHAAHPVATEVPPGYDGSTNWFKYADAVEEWCDLTKVEARGVVQQLQLVYRAERRFSRKDSPETACEIPRQE